VARCVFEQFLNKICSKTGICFITHHFAIYLDDHLFRYVTSHKGQLSLAIHLWVGAMSTNQRAVMPCGWGVNAVCFVCECQVKLCDLLLLTGHIWAL